MKQIILLTGATGNVGFETLKELLKFSDRYEIRTFDLATKKNKRKLTIFKKKINCFWGDIRNYNDVLKAVNGCDFIIHTAAIIPPAADKYTKPAEEVNTGGTENICKAISQINPEIFLLYTSSISVYGDRIKNPKITVNDKLNPSEGDFYALTKIKAENIIKNTLKNYSIFRLSAVMHPQMKLDPLFFHMPLNTSLEIITTRNLAYALVAAIDKKDKIKEKIFNIGGGEKCRISYKNFLTENFKIFGLKELNFPKYAFAEKNFHCGFYKDSINLNHILNFQKDTIDDYFIQVNKNVRPFKKFLTQIFNNIVLNNLLQQSEPFNAMKTKNEKMIRHFFYTQNN